jgi:hypothetical protein
MVVTTFQVQQFVDDLKKSYVELFLRGGGNNLSGAKRASKKTEGKLRISKYLSFTSKKRAIARRKRNKLRIVAETQKY